MRIDIKTMQRLADQVVSEGLAENFELDEQKRVIKAIIRPGYQVTEADRTQVQP